MSTELLIPLSLLLGVFLLFSVVPWFLSGHISREDEKEEEKAARSLPYVLIRAHGTSCPKCGEVPRLLCADVGVWEPAFYICRCGFIGQVAVGEVGTGLDGLELQPEYDEDDEDDDNT